jgi:hypothetical protein
MAEEKKDSKSKIGLIVLFIVIGVLLIGGAVTLMIILSQKPANVQVQESSTTAVTTEKNPLKLSYDVDAVALDEKSLENQIDQLQKVAEGYITLEYQNDAFSEDGKVFSCYLANATENTEDMFIGIFTDATMAEQIYLSGLLKPGSVIQNFTSEIPFEEKGTYSAVAIFTTVDDDHETLTGQIPVAIKLTVN